MFNFLLTRLKNASLGEISYRVRQRVRVARVRRAVRRGQPPYPSAGPALAATSGLTLPSFHPEISGALVEALLDGWQFTLNTGRKTLLEWEAELGARKRCVAPRGAGVADIRALWEPARLQHLTLLLAFLSQKGAPAAGERVAQFARAELLHWLDANPFPSGPHYRSAMECGLRLPVFFYALKLLPGLTRDEFQRVSAAAYNHARWIEGNLSLYSSLGNHTVCECLGLVFAGAMFQETAQGKLWLERGVALLRQELAHQVLSDGGCLEQSLSYHRFVLDLYWLAVDFLGANRLHDCSDFLPRLLAGESFLAAFCDERGLLPPLGDCDDGHALAPGLSPARGAVPRQAPGYLGFDEAGYTVIKGERGMRLTFDHGPLGMPPLHNHGHADALSITLSLEGVDLLVDPGTYRYNGAPAERRYFKSTPAHNTVTVDGLDQAVQETGFIWSKPYQSRVLRREHTEGGYLVEAQHDGYLRLKEPLRHSRAIHCFERGDLVLRDSFQGAGEHDFALHYHLHPGAVVSREGLWWCIRREGCLVRMRLLACDELELIEGWYSPSYGIKRPSGVLRSRKKGGCRETSFQTLISLSGDLDSRQLETRGGAL
jgi:hypothetical protein